MKGKEIEDMQYSRVYKHKYVSHVGLQLEPITAHTHTHTPKVTASGHGEGGNSVIFIIKLSSAFIFGEHTQC